MQMQSSRKKKHEKWIKNCKREESHVLSIYMEIFAFYGVPPVLLCKTMGMLDFKYWKLVYIF